MHDPAEIEASDTGIEGLEPGNARNGNDNHSHLSLGHVNRHDERLLFVHPIDGHCGDCKIDVRVHHT